MTSNTSQVPVTPMFEVDVDVIKMVEYVVQGILLSTFAVFGLISNTVTLIVLSRPQMRTAAINCCLQALAAYDWLVAFTSFFLMGFMSLGRPWNECHVCKRYFVEVLPHIAVVLYPIAAMAQMGSVWCTVSVTIERYIAVCHPLHARNMCTYRRARLGVLGVTLFSILYNVPRYWEQRKHTYFNDALQENITVLRMTEFRQNKLYVNIYHNWMYLIFVAFGPMLILCALNFRIWRTVRLANFRRQSLTSYQKNERRLVYMLFSVVLVFFSCNIVVPVVNLCELLGKVAIYHLLAPLSNCLVVLNSSVNVFIYCVYCKKFRIILLRMFCPGHVPLLRKQSGSSSRRATMSTVDLIRRKTRMLSKSSSSDTKSSMLNT